MHQTTLSISNPVNKDIKEIQLKDIWNKKQKRSFNAIKTGLSVCKKENKIVRFLTLTTSEIQIETEGYDINQLNDHHRKLKQRIQRMTPLKMVQQGYIKAKDLRRYYPDLDIGQNLGYEYFKVQTDEGNGVLHILYKGSYLPYNYLVDNWQDIHNTWDLNIKKIGFNKGDIQRVSGYVVSQYLSSQTSSYVRSSQSWKWLFKGYRKAWLNFLDFYIRDRKNQYKDYLGNWHSPYKDKMGINFKDIIAKWNTTCYNMIHGWYIPSLEMCNSNSGVK